MLKLTGLAVRALWTQQGSSGYAGRELRALAAHRGSELKVPKLRHQTLETAIIEHYRRWESSVEEALLEMYLAAISVRRVGASRGVQSHSGAYTAVRGAAPVR
jgi:transposase-like protein